jgi:hypothetical protein
MQNTSSGVTPYGAVVTLEGKLCTRGDNSTRETFRAVQGWRFLVASGQLSLPTGFDGPVLWIKNTDNDRNFHVTRIVNGWNGGDTNHNRVCFTTGLFNSGEPSANETSIEAVNTNLSSNRSALMTAYKWDGVGVTGLTVAGGGGSAVNVNTQGETVIMTDGALVIPAGNTLAVSCQNEEAGEFSAQLAGYYEDIE